MFGSGLFFKLVREIDQAVQQELDSEQQAILSRLRQLHQQLESGAIDDARFDEAEERLLARLEQIKRMRRG